MDKKNKIKKQTKLKGKISLGFLVADGFEDIELFSTYDICKRAGINCFLYSVDNLHEVTSAYGIKMIVDNRINDIKLNDIDGLVIPGGGAGVAKLNNYFDVHTIIQEFYKNKKLIAAICAGPLVLTKAKILKNKKVTCYPDKNLIAEIKKQATVDTKAKVCCDGNIITSQGPATAILFGLEIVNYFFDKKIMTQIKNDVLI